MDKGSKKGHSKKNPTYIGIFAKDGKEAVKTVKSVCKDSLLQIMKQINPQSYLQQGEYIDKSEKIHELERQPTHQQVIKVERDLLCFQEWSTPQDNYHITCLFIGGKPIEKLNQKQGGLFKTWKEGLKQSIKIDFLVYVPNCLIAGYASDLGEAECSNDFPHMTLLLKAGTSAVQSNSMLQTLHKYHPGLFKNREKRITLLNIPFKQSSIMFVIDTKFELQGLCGNNFIHGRCEK